MAWFSRSCKLSLPRNIAHSTRFTPIRLVSTDATTSKTDKKKIPKHGDEDFKVTLPSNLFEFYKIEMPSLDIQVNKNQLQQMYKEMVTIRRMEMSADKLYKQGKIRGFCHLSTGQEAIAVGIEHCITKDDNVITSYRCHGFTYMRGGTVKQVIAELLGRRAGISYGKGGSMHMFAKSFFGGNGIVGAHVPVGTGIGFAMKYSGRPQATFALYGDGAANQGQVFEAFNMAALWKVPVVYCCENNKYGMGTSAERSSASTEYFKRGQFIPGIRVNGMDVLAVVKAASFAKQWTLDGNGPLILEFVTYRYSGHSMSDPGTSYRSREEIQRMRSTNDAIEGLKHKILEWNVMTEDELKQLDKETKAEVDEEVKAAEAAPPPEARAEILYEDTYVRGTEPLFLRGRTTEEIHYFQ